MSMKDGIVKVLLDPDGYLVQAGEMENLSLKEKREMGDLMLKGYVIKQMPIEEYRATTWKWYWERPEQTGLKQL